VTTVRERVAGETNLAGWFTARARATRLDALPRNPTGKVLKVDLRERYS
jgi:acyl-CoA synthetase (AMP-forming)/AMP-acid ligase II